jgi:hypothetical protein
MERYLQLFNHGLSHVHSLVPGSHSGTFKAERTTEEQHHLTTDTTNTCGSAWKRFVPSAPAQAVPSNALTNNLSWPRN